MIKKYYLVGLEYSFALILLVIFVALAFLFIFSPAPSVFGQEQNSVFAVLRYQLTGTLFTEPSLFPFTALQYGPLYYRLIRVIGWLFDMPASAAHVYRVGRSIAALANLLTIVVLWIALRRLGNVPRPTAAVISMGALFTLMPWGFIVHPDSLHLLLVFTGLILTLLPGALVSSERVGLCTAMIALAVFVKLTAVFFIPLPLFLAMLYPGPRMQISRYIFHATVASVTVALIFTNGLLIRNWVVALNQPISISEAVVEIYILFLQRYAILVTVGILAALTAIFSQSWRLKAVVLCALWSCGIGLALGIKVGAGLNYFLLLLVFLTLAGGMLGFSTSTTSGHAYRRNALICLIPFYIVSQIGWVRPYINSARSDRAAEYNSLNKILQAIPDPRAFILELDGNLSLVAADRVMLATPDVMSWVAVPIILPNKSLETALRLHEVCWAVINRSAYETMQMQSAPSGMTPAQWDYLKQVQRSFDDVLNLPERILMRAKFCRLT